MKKDIEHEYHPIIKNAVNALIEELEKTYPKIKKFKYEKGGDIWYFRERMEMNLYFELFVFGKKEFPGIEGNPGVIEVSKK